MMLGRFAVDLFIERPRLLDLRRLIPTLHEWINRSLVDGLLIDVADYSHVEDGPGLVLVGHEGDHRISSGRDGSVLTYVDKARGPSAATTVVERLDAAFRAALRAGQVLEQTAPDDLGIRLRTDEARVTLLDRLHTPNDESTEHKVRPALQEVSRRLYGSEVTIDTVFDDRRRPLSLLLRAEQSPELEALRSQPA